jgi:Flp pilus assembly protein TadD
MPLSPDELIARYEGLLAKRPGDELLRFSLGKALYDAGRFAEAEKQLQLALAAKPDWMVVTMLLAQCALRRDDKAEAKALYEKALQFAIDQHHEDPENEIRAQLAKL